MNGVDGCGGRFSVIFVVICMTIFFYWFAQLTDCPKITIFCHSEFSFRYYICFEQYFTIPSDVLMVLMSMMFALQLKLYRSCKKQCIEQNSWICLRINWIVRGWVPSIEFATLFLLACNVFGFMNKLWLIRQLPNWD